MKQLRLAVARGAVEVQCPTLVAEQLPNIVCVCDDSAPKIHGNIVVEPSGNGPDYQLIDSNGKLRSNLQYAELLPEILHSLTQIHAGLISDQLAIKANAVEFSTGNIVIADADSMAKDDLTNWLLDQGHMLCGGGMLVVNDKGSITQATQMALAENAGEARKNLNELRAGQPLSDKKCGMILIAEFQKKTEAGVSLLSSTEATLRLLALVKNSGSLVDGGFAAAQSLAQKVPVFLVRFETPGHLSQHLDQLIQLLNGIDLDAEQLRTFVSLVARPGSQSDDQPDANSFPAPLATSSRGPRRLTIGMATYDDFDGVYFTLQSLRLHHPEVADEAEIIVVDNNPTGFIAHELKQFETTASNFRYIPFNQVTGTSASRDLIFREATGDYVVVMDCHVMLAPGALQQLDAYFQDNTDCRDLLQGPLLQDDLESVYTQFDPVWENGMYGRWGSDIRGRDPQGAAFEIQMHGLGLFACRRAVWPGFNDKFRGFGGEEGYIHEKFRRHKGRTLCLPFLRWIHRFKRPLGIKYPIIWEDRIRNYLIGFEELGLPIDPMIEHFSALVGEEFTRSVVESVRKEPGFQDEIR